MRIETKTTCGRILVWAGLGVMSAACTQSPGLDPSAFGEGCEADGGCEAETADSTSSDPESEDRTPEGETDGSSGGGDPGDSDHDRCGDVDSPYTADGEECGDDDDDGRDPSGGDDDSGGDGGSEPTCCDEGQQDCLDNGETSSTCSSLHEMCVNGSCDQLVEICDPGAIPVSRSCASAYFGCYDFLVNKCLRVSYDVCVQDLGDTDLCAAWDDSCAARELYCNQLLCPGELCDLEYYCTDWGHDFDPCWDEYVACADDPAACESTLRSCAMETGFGGIGFCFDDEDEPEDDPDEPTDSGDPAG